MPKSDDHEWLRKRLDMVIQLLLEITPDGANSTTRKIQRLIALGFSQAETAQVIGKPPNYVGAVVSDTKKRASAKASKKKVAAEPPAPPIGGEP